MSSAGINTENPTVPNPLVAPLVAPPVETPESQTVQHVQREADQLPSPNQSRHGVENAQLESGTLLPVSEPPSNNADNLAALTGADGVVTAADGVHHTEAKAKAIAEASKAQSIQAKKSKSSVSSKLQGSAANTGSQKAPCPVGGETQLNMIFSHLNGLVMKVEKLAQGQDKIMRHVENVRESIEEMYPHIVDEDDEEYEDDEESEEETEEEDSEEEVPLKKGKASSSRKRSHVEESDESEEDDDDDEISDREHEDVEIAVTFLSTEIPVN